MFGKNAQKLLGYTPKEVMGEILVKEFIINEYKLVVQAVLDQAFQEEETGNFEFPLMTKVSVCFDDLLNATTRCNEQGNTSGVVGIRQDITNALIFGVDTVG
jgi:PAS domain S-box-containing protein